MSFHLTIHPSYTVVLPCFAKSKTYSEWTNRQMAICHPWKHQEKIDLQWQHHNNKSDLCKGSFQIPKSQTTTNNQRTTTKLNHLILECAPSPPPPPKKKRKTYKNRESYKNGTHCSFLWHCLKTNMCCVVTECFAKTTMIIQCHCEVHSDFRFTN